MKLRLRLQNYDYEKLTKNVVAAVLTPAATVFSTTGDMEQTKHAALLGVGAAGLIVLGFIQTPYKRPKSDEPPASGLPAEGTRTND